MNESGNLKYSMMTIYNKTALNTRNLLRQWLSLRCFHHTQREVELWEGMDVNQFDCSIHFTVSMYIKTSSGTP